MGGWEVFLVNNITKNKLKVKLYLLKKYNNPTSLNFFL